MERELTELFAQAGQVESVQIITDRDTGRSKGFAFVEMSNDEVSSPQLMVKSDRSKEDARNSAYNEERNSPYGEKYGGFHPNLRLVQGLDHRNRNHVKGKRHADCRYCEELGTQRAHPCDEHVMTPNDEAENRRGNH